jgi:hypothetical protein
MNSIYYHVNKTINQYQLCKYDITTLVQVVIDRYPETMFILPCSLEQLPIGLYFFASRIFTDKTTISKGFSIMIVDDYNKIDFAIACLFEDDFLEEYNTKSTIYDRGVCINRHLTQRFSLLYPHTGWCCVTGQKLSVQARNINMFSIETIEVAIVPQQYVS